ncbi:hypothetical protein FQA39_LY17274 [Lamprigera yunnana]|nr:hypothetical protein FQA39_LY17274 [Lamprigera yunnana]
MFGRKKKSKTPLAVPTIVVDFASSSSSLTSETTNVKPSAPPLETNVNIPEEVESVEDCGIPEELPHISERRPSLRRNSISLPNLEDLELNLIQHYAQDALHEQTCDMMWKLRQIGSKTLTFEMIEEKKILRIEDMCGNEVYLGWESVSEVWSLETVLNYRLSYSSGSNFKHFCDDVIRAVVEISGDVKINIYNIVNRLSEKTDDLCYMLEVLLFIPEEALFDVQLERRIQEQEQHWTKAIDLKSAVERLYEKFGALEFDADHEAIYSMEKYYTVNNVKSSEINIRLEGNDSGASSSSDDKECKAVEQNGEDSKTTEEEESKKSKGERITKPVS